MRKTSYTFEDIKERVAQNSNCTFVDTYMVASGKSTKRMLTLICACGERFDVAWVKFNRNDGLPQRQCRKCGLAYRGLKQRMSNAEYTQRKLELGIEIEHLEVPRGRNVGIKHICPECLTDDWYPYPANILSGASTKCLDCHMGNIGGHNKQDDDWYQKEKASKGLSVQNIHPYITSSTPIWHVCPECGGGWLVRPSGILTRNSCACIPCSYKLRGEAASLPVEEVEKMLSDLSVEWVSGEYEGKDSILSLRCDCGNLFQKRFSDVRSGWNRCKKCAQSISTGELAISRYLDAMLTQYIPQQKFDNLRGKRNMPLSYDFGVYCGNKLIALIEYDGGHHFHPIYSRYKTKDIAEEVFEGVKNRDKRKDEYAKTIGIPLIRLNGKDYKNLDAKLGEQLRSIKQ